MRAVTLSEFRSPLVVHDLPDPTAAAEEFLVDMTFAAVNPLDIWVCNGNFAGVTPLPHIPGAEGVGRLNGQTVLLRGHGLGLARPGTYAQRIAVPAGSLIVVPDGVDEQQAAAVGVAGLTAHRAVHTLGECGPSDTVLVLGASGGVGSLAVQLARATGARVLGQTSSEAKTLGVAALGAEPIVAADGAALLAALGDNAPSLVCDGLGGVFTAAAIDAMAPFGRLVTYGTSAGEQSTLNMRALYRKGLKVVGYTGIREDPTTLGAAFDELFASLAAGRLHISIDDVLPLDEAAEAHRRILDREVEGKLLLDVNR